MESQVISIRVKFRESEKRVEVRPHDQILVLKVTEFQEEMINSNVRVIFRGKEIQDHDTFRSINMQDNDICHVTVAQKKNSVVPSLCAGKLSGDRDMHSMFPNSTQDSSMLASADMFVIAVMTICMLFWMILFALPEVLLSPPASILMTCITIVSTLACFARASVS